MKIRLEAHALPGAFIIRNQNMVLKTPADVAEWKRQLTAEIETKIEPGKKVYFLVDLAGVQIAGAVADEYGRVVKELVYPISSSIIRFGSSRGTTAAAIDVAAVMNNYPNQILPDEAAATDYLQRLRGF